MGCGTWGGNSVNENVNYRHFLVINENHQGNPSREPSLDDIFADYWSIAGQQIWTYYSASWKTVCDWLDLKALGGVAFVFPETGEELNWQDLRDQAAQVSGDMTAQGISKGDSVVIMHPNGPDGVKALYSVLYGGFRATMLNLAAGPDALAMPWLIVVRWSLLSMIARWMFLTRSGRNILTVTPRQAKLRHCMILPLMMMRF